jgi:hypothetical protein
LYTALEGRPPVGAVEDDTEALLARITEEEIAAPTRAGPLADVLLQLLRRDPAQRPTMAEAAELLAKVSAGPGTALVAAPVAHRPTRMRRTVLVAAVVGVIAAAVAIGLAVGNAPTEPGTVLPPTPKSGGATDASCSATAAVTQSWHGGYKVLVTVRNAGPAELKGWAVTWQPAAGRQVDDLWDGSLQRSGVSVTVVNAVWNATVTGNGATSFGLITLDDGAGRATEPLICRAL